MFCLIYSMAEFETLHFMFLWLNFPLVFFSLGWCIFIAIFFVQCLNFSYLISSLGRCIFVIDFPIQWVNFPMMISSLDDAFLWLISKFNGFAFFNWWIYPQVLHFQGWFLCPMGEFSIMNSFLEMHFYGWFSSSMGEFSINEILGKCISMIDFMVQWPTFPLINSSFISAIISLIPIQWLSFPYLINFVNG